MKNRALLICCSRWGYDLQIQACLENLGYVVQRESNVKKNIVHGLAVLLGLKGLLRLMAKKRGQEILRSIEEPFDLVLVFHGFEFGDSFYKHLKLLNANAYFVNYTWDSIRPTPYGRDQTAVYRYFDKCATFDLSDSKRWGIEYQPLFSLVSEIDISDNQLYDLAFIGSLSSLRRYEELLRWREFCTENGLILFEHVVVSLPFYLKMMLKGVWMKGVTLKQMSFSELEAIYEKSKAVLDIPQQVQSGLTMRTIETLSMGQRLVTSNNSIRSHEFYRSDCIMIYQESLPTLDLDWLNSTTHTKIDMERYSIGAWVKDLIS